MLQFTLANIYSGILSENPNQENLSEAIALSWIVAKTCWNTTILMWFFILVSTAAILFDELKKRLQKIAETASGLNTKNGAAEFKEWGRHHALVCKLVNRINDSFGIILVVAFSHGFISFITSSYRFINFLVNGDNPLEYFLYLFIFIEQAVFLSIFIIASYRLQSNVINHIYHVNLNDLI